jgi:hypothetical protein
MALSTFAVGPRVGVPLHFQVICVQGRFDQKNCSNAAGHLLHVTYFFPRQRSLQRVFLPIREPLLNDLIPADGVFPNPDRNFRPIGDVVQINVERPVV